MTDRFDETARRLGKPLDVFGHHGLTRLLGLSGGVAAAGLLLIVYDQLRASQPGWPTFTGLGVVFAAAFILLWRLQSVTRGVTVCRRGMVVKEQVRETEYYWDEISHVVIGRNDDPSDRTVAIVLIDGKRLNFAPPFWASEAVGHRQDAFLKLVRTYVHDVRRD